MLDEAISNIAQYSENQISSTNSSKLDCCLDEEVFSKREEARKVFAHEASTEMLDG